MLISSVELKNETITIPLLLFYLDLVPVCSKTHQVVDYTLVRCFNDYVQSGVDARRQEDENFESSVVVKTLKLLTNSSYGYQILDRGLHSVTKSFNDEKTHAAIHSKLFKRLVPINQ